MGMKFCNKRIRENGINKDFWKEGFETLSAEAKVSRERLMTCR